ncbi:unnamed protein product [Closterium sp. NIES-54]
MSLWRQPQQQQWSQQQQQWRVQLQRLQQPPQRGPDGPGQYTHRYVGAATAIEPCVSSLGACVVFGPGASVVLSVGAAATTRPAFVVGSGATSPIARLSFTLDSGASSCFFLDCTDLTPLHTPITVSLADPSVGSVVAESTTTLPCPAAPSGFLTGYYTPSFSRNLVGVSHLHDLRVVTTFPLHEPVASYTVGATGAPLATFHREPVSGLQESLAPLPCSHAPLCTPCIEGQQHAAPHSSSFPPTTAPLQTLHLDVWGPSPDLGPRQERYFLIVVDDYSRYTKVFPLRQKADVPTVLEPWLLGKGGVQGLCGLHLYSDRGVRYAAHQLNVWPTDAWPRVTPIFLWTGWVFYDPVTHQFFASHDVTFDESVSYYRSRPHQAPPPSRPAPSGVSHVTPQSSPPQRLVSVVSGGAGGVVAEGEGTGAAGARRASSGGAEGVRVENTPEEDTAVSTQRPRPASPPRFPSVPQFPPSSPPRPVTAEPGGVPVGGTGVPGGLVDGGSGSGAAAVSVGGSGESRGGFAAAAAALSDEASGESRGGVAAAAVAVVSVGASGESRGGVTAVAAAVVVSVGASGESRGGIAAAAGVSVGASGEGRGGVTAAVVAAAVSVGASGESRGGLTAAAAAALSVGASGESRGGVTSAAGAGTVAADARGGGVAATTTARPARPSTCTLGLWSSTVHFCSCPVPILVPVDSLFSP